MSIAQPKYLYDQFSRNQSELAVYERPHFGFKSAKIGHFWHFCINS